MPTPPANTQTVPAPHAGARQSQRRAARRWPPAQFSPCVLATEAGRDVGSGWVFNLSSLGVAVVVPQKVTAGTTVLVRLLNSAHTTALEVPVHVVRCVRTFNGHYLVGGRFLRRLT